METQIYKGYEITVDYDLDPIDPRRVNDNMGIMAFFHGRYRLGDYNHGYSIKDVDAIIKRKDVISIPVYMMDHSGLTISADAERFRACDPQGWDWGKIGYIFVDRDRACKWLGISRITAKQRERIRQHLLDEVEEYDGYIRGDRHHYIIKKDGEVVDTCCDFYSEESAMESAKAWIG